MYKCSLPITLQVRMHSTMWWTHPYEHVSAVGFTPQDVTIISVTLTEASTTPPVPRMAGCDIQTDVC